MYQSMPCLLQGIKRPRDFVFTEMCFSKRGSSLGFSDKFISKDDKFLADWQIHITNGHENMQKCSSSFGALFWLDMAFDNMGISSEAKNLTFLAVSLSKVYRFENGV